MKFLSFHRYGSLLDSMSGFKARRLKPMKHKNILLINEKEFGAEGEDWIEVYFWIGTWYKASEFSDRFF